MTPALGLLAILVAAIAVRAALAAIRADRSRRAMFARLAVLWAPEGADPMAEAFGDVCEPGGRG